jgi:hypothetical protein
MQKCHWQSTSIDAQMETTIDNGSVHRELDDWMLNAIADVVRLIHRAQERLVHRSTAEQSVIGTQMQGRITQFDRRLLDTFLER